MSPRFRSLWARIAKPGGGDSQSEYDMAIAVKLAEAGFSDAELVHALVEHRCAGGLDAKRQGYYDLTIGKARVFAAELEEKRVLDEARSAALRAMDESMAQERGQEAAPAASEVTPVPSVASGPASTTAAPAASGGEVGDQATEAPPGPWDAIRQVVGVPLLGVEKVLSEPLQWHFLFEGDRCFVFDKPSWMTSHSGWRLKAAEILDVWPPKVSTKNWERCVALILREALHVRPPEGSTTGERLQEALREYLSDEPIVDDADQGAAARVPLRISGRVHVALRPFVAWLNREAWEGLGGVGVVSSAMRTAGAEYVAVNYTGHDGTRSTRGYYRVPASFDV